MISKTYTPDELRILFDVLNSAPAYLSKRFVLMHLCGWSEEMVELNMRMKLQEQSQIKIGDKTWQ